MVEELHLDELRAHLLRWDGLQLRQLALIAHRADQGEAVTVGEEVFDGLPYLQQHALLALDSRPPQCQCPGIQGWSTVEMASLAVTYFLAASEASSTQRQSCLCRPILGKLQIKANLKLEIVPTLFLASTDAPLPSTECNAVSRYSLGVSCQTKAWSAL